MLTFLFGMALSNLEGREFAFLVFHASGDNNRDSPALTAEEWLLACASSWLPGQLLTGHQSKWSVQCVSCWHSAAQC